MSSSRTSWRECCRIWLTVDSGLGINANVYYFVVIDNYFLVCDQDQAFSVESLVKAAKMAPINAVPINQTGKT